MRSRRQKLSLSQLPTRRSPRFSSAHLSPSSRTPTPIAADGRDEDSTALALSSIHQVENNSPSMVAHTPENNSSRQSLRRSSRFTTNIYKTPAPKTCKSEDSTALLRRSPRLLSSAPALSAQVVGLTKRGRSAVNGERDMTRSRGGRNGIIEAPQLLELPEKMVDNISLGGAKEDEKVVDSVEESGVYSVRCLRSRTVKMLVVTKKKKISGELSVGSGEKCQELALIEYPPKPSDNRNVLRTSQRLIEESTPERLNLETLMLTERSVSHSIESRSVEKSEHDSLLTESRLEVNCLVNKELCLDGYFEAHGERNLEGGEVLNAAVRVISDLNDETSDKKTFRSCRRKDDKIVECRFIGTPIAQEVAEKRWHWRYELKRQRKGNGWKLNADEDDEIILNVSCHYDQAIIGSTVLDIGDYVHVKGDGEKKHVGKILEFFRTSEGENYCRLQWFFRAEDTVLKDAASSHDKRRIFISDLMNDNLLDCIISKVNVVRVHPKQCLQSSSLKSSSYYYDMEYCVDYSTFRTLSPPEESAERESQPFKRDLALLDLFCGCGGMSTGLCLGAQSAGLNLETKWSVDYNSSACESLSLNHPKTQVRNESAEDFLQLLKEWEHLCKVYCCDIEKSNCIVEYQSADDSSSSEVYEVLSLVDICYGDPNGTGKRGVHFKVRWKGYAPDEDTWEPIKGLSNCQEKIQDFVLKGFQSRILPLPGDADVVCGGPPCQGISGYNRHRNFDSPLSDERNRQIIVFMDIVEFLQPKYVLMENVVDIIKFDGGSLGRYALSRLVGMRYQSRMGTIASGCYGLPQFRLRIFMWGAHPNASLPRFPLPTHDVIVRYGPPVEFGRNLVGYDEGQPRNLEKAMLLGDSISDLPSVGNDESREEIPYDKPPETEFQRYMREGSSRVLYDHRPLQLSEDEYLRVCQIPRRKGANFRNLAGVVVGRDNVARRAPDMDPILLPSGKLLVPNSTLSFDQGKSKRPYGRLWWDETVSTLLTFPHIRSMPVLHPEQDRTLTVREYARLQGFPDYYRFCGTVKERYCQIGNAVSVPVAKALGYALGTACKKAGGHPHDEPLMILPPKFLFSRPSDGGRGGGRGDKQA